MCCGALPSYAVRCCVWPQFIATDAAEDFGDPSTVDERLLQRLPGLHKAPAASVDINMFRQARQAQHPAQHMPSSLAR